MNPPCLSGLISEKEEELKHKNQSTVIPLIFVQNWKFSQLHQMLSWVMKYTFKSDPFTELNIMDNVWAYLNNDFPLLYQQKYSCLKGKLKICFLTNKG